MGSKEYQNLVFGVAHNPYSMRIIKIIVSFVLLFSLFGLPTKDSAEELQIKEMSAKEQVWFYSTIYGANPVIVDKVIQCESGYNNSAIGDGKNAQGIGQFWEETFNRMSKKLGEKLDYNSSHDQIKLLSFAMANPTLAKEWTSYRAIINGGSYTFYSKYFKKTITVYCN